MLSSILVAVFMATVGAVSASVFDESTDVSVEAADGNIVKIVTTGTTTEYATLQEAVNNITTSESTTIEFISTSTNTTYTGPGVVVPEGKNITIDFKGCTYVVVNPTVGSPGTKTNGFQLLKDSTIEFKNGTIQSTIAKILIQNYSNLTLTNMTLDVRGSTGSAGQYALSNNYGDVKITGETNIYARSGYVAFDVWFGLSSTYYKGVSVTFGTDSNPYTGTVIGNIEYGSQVPNHDSWRSKACLTINGGEFIGNITKSSDNALDGASIVIKGGAFTDLVNAFKFSTSGSTISLADNCSGGGLFLGAGSKTITLDFNGFTYTATAPAVGSSGTESQAFHFEKGNTVTLINGTLKLSNEPTLKMGIQNYCTLTLDSFNIDASIDPACLYALSINCGTVLINGTTNITAYTGKVAFDVCAFASYTGGTVTVNTTGTIDGKIELSRTSNPATYSLIINSGTFEGNIVEEGSAGIDVTINGGTFDAPGTQLISLVSSTLTISEDYTLNIPSGKEFVIGANATLTNDGIIKNSGTITNNGNIGNIDNNNVIVSNTAITGLTENITFNVTPTQSTISLGGTEFVSGGATIYYIASPASSYDYEVSKDGYYGVDGTVLVTTPASTVTESLKEICDVTYNVNGGIGDVPTGNQYAAGDTVTVLFTPVPSKEGYNFAGWAATADATAATFTSSGTTSFVATGGVTLYAVYVLPPNSYVITATAGAGGTVSPAEQVVALNGNAKVAITANADYKVSDVLVDGVSVGAVNSYEFSAVTKDHVLTAVFEYSEGTETIFNPSTGYVTETTTKTEGTVTEEVKKSTSPSGDVALEAIIKDESTGVETTATNSSEGKAVETTINVIAETEDKKATAEIPDEAIAEAVRQATEAAEKVGADNVTPTVVIKTELPKSSDAKETAVEISEDSIESIANAGGDMKVESPTGTVVLDNNAVSNLAGNTGPVKISIGSADKEDLNEKQKEKVGDNLIISASAFAGDSAVHQLGGKATITFEYTLKEGEDPDNIVIWYLDDTGNIENFPAVYDAVSKTVSFVTDHFSYYVVAFEEYSGESGGSDDSTMFLILGVAAVLIIALAVGVYAVKRRTV